MERAKSLQNGNNARARSKSQGARENGGQRTFEAIADDVKEHRLSMLQRPKSAGSDRQRTRARPYHLFEQPTKRSEDLQKYVRTIEYSTGVDTFYFPTPAPRLPPRSATFDVVPSSKTNRVSRIGVAIGSPTQVSPGWHGSPSCAYVSPRSAQTWGSSPSQPAPSDLKSIKKQASSIRSRKMAWKGFTDLFRKNSRIVKVAQAWRSPQITKHSDSLRQGAQDPRAVESGLSLTPRVSTEDPPLKRRPTYTQLFDDVQGMSQSPIPLAKLEAENETLHTSGSSAPTTWPHVAPLRIRKITAPDLGIIIPDIPPPLAGAEQTQSAISMPEKAPRIELEIPQMVLERYSVMFEKLFKRESTPTLMERRSQRIIPLKLDSRTSVTSATRTASGARPSNMTKMPIPINMDSSPHRPFTADGPRSKSGPLFGSHTVMSKAKPVGQQVPEIILSKQSSGIQIRQAFLVCETSPLSLDSSCPTTPATAGLPYAGTFPPQPESTFKNIGKVEEDDGAASPTIDGLHMHHIQHHGLILRNGPSHPVAQIRVLGCPTNELQTRSSPTRALASTQPLKPRVVELHRSRKSAVLVV